MYSFVENNELNINKLLQAQKQSVKWAMRMTLLDLELHKWNEIHKRDRLLGCSLTGWQDMVNELNLTKEQENTILSELKLTANETAKEYAKELNINVPKLITTVKPEGTISLMPSVSSGLHYSHSEYFIRRIQIEKINPLVETYRNLGYNIVAKSESQVLIEFPMEAPKGKTKYDVSAIEQLENYKRFMNYYVEHNASITVNVRSHEWESVIDWVYENWDNIVAISFLSLDDNFYENAPFEAITKAKYEKMKSKIKSNEQNLTFNTSDELLQDSECAGGACPVR